MAKSPMPGVGYPFQLSCWLGVPETPIQAFAIALGYPRKLDGKTLLLKTSYTHSTANWHIGYTSLHCQACLRYIILD